MRVQGDVEPASRSPGPRWRDYSLTGPEAAAAVAAGLADAQWGTFRPSTWSAYERLRSATTGNQRAILPCG